MTHQVDGAVVQASYATILGGASLATILGATRATILGATLAIILGGCSCYHTGGLLLPETLHYVNNVNVRYYLLENVRIGDLRRFRV